MEQFCIMSENNVEVDCEVQKEVPHPEGETEQYEEAQEAAAKVQEEVESNGDAAPDQSTEVKENDLIKFSIVYINPVNREVFQLTLRFYNNKGNKIWQNSKFEEISCLPATTMSDIRNHINRTYCDKGKL